MANPTLPSNDRKFDRDGIYWEGEGLIVNDKVVVSTQQTNVIDVAAATASNPTAPTAYSAHTSGSTPVTSNAATDLDTTAAALATLVTEVTTYETAISALIVDVALMRTAINAILDVLEAHGLMADA